MASEKKIFEVFPIKRMGDRASRRGQFESQGHDWQDFLGDHLMLLHTKYLSSGPYGFREEDFLSCSHYKSMGANKPWSNANLDPRGMAGRIYVDDHFTLLHTKYLSSGSYGFREEDFLSFFHYKSMGANELWGVANLDPRGMIGRIYVGDHRTLLHTKYLSSGPDGFRKEDFFFFFFFFLNFQYNQIHTVE